MHEDNFDIPILFCIFNRPDPTQEVFNQIKKIKPAKIYISADGPRVNKIGEKESCLKTREIIKQIDWNCEIHTRLLEENHGCGNAISSAITWMFESEDMGIILEDDCVPSLDFFQYCRYMLGKYKDVENIYAVCGEGPLCYSDGEVNSDYYFTRFFGCWGWATWKRAWKIFDINITLDKKWQSNFINDKYYRQMHEYQEFLLYSVDKIKYEIKNDIKPNAWAAAWSLSIIKSDGLCIKPLKNLVTNIGDVGAHIDRTTASGWNNLLNRTLYSFDIVNTHHPDVLCPSRLIDTKDTSCYVNLSKTFKIALNISFILRRIGFYPRFSPKYHLLTLGGFVKSKLKKMIIRSW